MTDSTRGMAVDTPTSMHTGGFSVQIDGEEMTGWELVDLPSRSIEQTEYREGDMDEARKLWGQPTFDDLEMERRIAPGDDRLWQWQTAIVEGRADAARRDVTVQLTDEAGRPRVEWQFSSAWVKEYSPPELDASADGDVATESITVAYDRMKRTEV